jgi:ribonuclease HI
MDSPLFSNVTHSLFFDGCSKGNPGRSGIGAVIYNNDEEIWASHKYIGDNKTNNEAEYSALLFGLEKALEFDIKKICVYGDSLLVIKQINKQYRVNEPKLIPLFEQAKTLIAQFDFIVFTHVYRKDNKRADELSNMGITNI